MARARSGSVIKPKLNMLFYGEPGVGKSTMALQTAYFKREDGTPFRVLVLDAESGGCEECLTELAENGIDLQNIYIVYSQSQKEIKDYIANTSNRDNKAMKYLYELDDMKLLTQQISMLALHANMKRVQNIASITHQEFHAAMNPEHVSLALGLYTYFTVIVNGNVDADKFNELFVESWINYYGNVQARLFMFKMRGNNWKNDFNGVLLDD